MSSVQQSFPPLSFFSSARLNLQLDDKEQTNAGKDKMSKFTPYQNRLDNYRTHFQMLF